MGETRSTSSVLSNIEGQIGRLVINRPHVRNALDNEALAELHSALDTFEQERCRAVVISGAGGTFCAGSDVKALRANDAAYQDWHTVTGQSLFNRLEAAPFLTIAVVAGYCLGGGVELTLVCDVRVAVADSVWGFPEVTLGAIPSWGGTQRLPRYVGLGRAKRMLLTGDRLPASELVVVGLVDYLDSTLDDAEARATELARRAEAAPEQAFALVKRLALASFDTPGHVGAWLEKLADDAIAGSIKPLPTTGPS